MLKFRKEEENKAAENENNEKNTLKNVVTITAAIGSVAVTGLIVKHFLFGEEKTYAEEEITQIETPTQVEKPEVQTEEPETEEPVHHPVESAESTTELKEENVQEPDETPEKSEAMSESEEKPVEAPEKPEPDNSSDPGEGDTSDTSDEIHEEISVHPGVTSSLVIYDTLVGNELNAALLSSCIDMLDKVIGDLNPIMDELSTNEKTVVDIAVDTLNGKLTIWWINCLDLLNVIYPDLGVRAKINVEGMYLKEKYSSIKYMKKSADVLKYQEETFSKLKEIEETENIRVMERIESETLESEQVSDETQAEPVETTGETQTVDNASVDEIQATESKEGETQTSEYDETSPDSLSVPIMEMTTIPKIKTHEEELFEQADKLIHELSELVPDEVPVTAIQISAVQSIVLQTARLYDELRSEVGSTVQVKKIRRYVNNTIVDLLNCCKTALTHPDLRKVEDAVYVEAIEDIILMVKTVKCEVSGFWRERTMTICDEITDIITKSQPSATTETDVDEVTEILVSNLPAIKEFGAHIEAVRDLLGSGKCSEAKDYYRNNLASYAEDPNLPEDIKERIKCVGDKITDVMISEKQVAATTEKQSKNRHAHKSSKKKGGKK